MAVFSFDPTAAKTWSKTMVNYLKGGGESVENCSKKFNQQLLVLIEPNVWTGDAARKNYDNFMNTHNALKKFTNDFGIAFQQSMTELSKKVKGLEEANLGKDSNVLSAFGTLTYDKIGELATRNVKIELVRYDYNKISSIGSELKKIEASLEAVSTKISKEIAKLGSGGNIWTGNAAESSKTTLSNTLNTNMKKVFDELKICISNITNAAKAAQAADAK